MERRFEWLQEVQGDNQEEEQKEELHEENMKSLAWLSGSSQHSYNPWTCVALCVSCIADQCLLFPPALFKRSDLTFDYNHSSICILVFETHNVDNSGHTVQPAVLIEF